MPVHVNAVGISGLRDDPLAHTDTDAFLDNEVANQQVNRFTYWLV